MMRSSMAILAASVIAIGGTALAQEQLPGPGDLPPVDQQQQQAQPQGGITAEQALEVARKHGLVHLKEIERDDDKWEVEGLDAEGREIEVEVNLRTGEVVDIERG